MERSPQQLNERIIAVDELVPSPSVRARMIFGILHHSAQGQTLTDWDVVCFCAEFLGMITSVYPWLEDDVRKIAKLVYTAHYLNENWKDENVLRFSTRTTESTSKTEQDSEGQVSPSKAEGEI